MARTLRAAADGGARARGVPVVYALICTVNIDFKNTHTHMALTQSLDKRGARQRFLTLTWAAAAVV